MKVPNKVLLHIGYPKCASTYLQEHVLPSIEGINFVSKRTHQAFYEATFKPEFDFDPKQVFETLPKSDLPLVISFERFLRPPQRGELGGIGLMARRLKALFPNATVNIVIRNQFDAIESFMLQWLLGGDVGGFGGVNRFMKMAQKGSFDLHYYNYPKIIGFYRTLFGDDQVNVFLLEDLVAEPDSFVRAFVSPVHSQLDSVGLPKERVRTRRSPLTYALLRILNPLRYLLLKMRGIAYGAGVNRWLYVTGNYLNRLYAVIPIFGHHPSMLDQASRDFIHRYYAESNRELEKMLGRSLGELGYPV